ncbi:MAG: biotin--[acetyl-CoA-carboxylase] ligase [Methanothrix sp.]|nr:biotin--[acetyl-CoA-carboxylase] ligase [Methanothrix sp.]
MKPNRPYREDPEATRLLRVLRGCGDAFVSTSDLVRVLKRPRRSVEKGLRRLRSLGCVLEEQASAGHRLLEVPDALRSEFVFSSGPEEPWGHPFHAYDSVTSTNDLCHALARNGAPEGAVVVAENQRKGRGRLGRSWASPKGKMLCFSLLLRPQLPPRRMSLLTLASAVAVAEALEEGRANPGIKWPNDVELDGRKVCGILTEGQADPDRLHYAVVGVGINLNVEPKDFPPELREKAISLREHLGRPVSRAAFFLTLLRRFREAYGLLAAGKGERLLKEWRLRSTVLGRQVRIRQGDRTLFGQALDVDAQGALLVRTDWGFTEAVTAGDVENLRLVDPASRRHRPVSATRGRL